MKSRRNKNANIAVRSNMMVAQKGVQSVRGEAKDDDTGHHLSMFERSSNVHSVQRGIFALSTSKIQNSCSPCSPCRLCCYRRGWSPYTVAIAQRREKHKQVCSASDQHFTVFSLNVSTLLAVAGCGRASKIWSRETINSSRQKLNAINHALDLM
jgi:hypothetical protein